MSVVPMTRAGHLWRLSFVLPRLSKFRSTAWELWNAARGRSVRLPEYGVWSPYPVDVPNAGT